MNKQQLDQFTLEWVENKINKWANEIAPQYQIDKDSFRIMVKEAKTPQKTRYGYLVQDGSYWPHIKDEHTVLRPKKTYIVRPSDMLHSHSQLLAEVRNGPIVQIRIFVPLMNQEGELLANLERTFKKMKAVVIRLFKYISSPKIHRDSELFNPLVLGDIVHEYVEGQDGTKVWKKRKFDPSLMSNHKKNEFEISIERRVTFKHKKTGIEYTITNKDTSRQEWDLAQECWERCSDLVEEKLIESKSKSVSLVPIYYDITSRFFIEGVRIEVQNG